MDQSIDLGSVSLLDEGSESLLDPAEEPPDPEHPPSLTRAPISFFPADADRFPALSNSTRFRLLHFPAITDADWNDWHWQLKNRITTLGQLEKILALTPDEIHAVANLRLPLSITPYYASLLHPDDPTQSLRRSVVPVSAWLTPEAITACRRLAGEACPRLLEAVA